MARQYLCTTECKFKIPAHCTMHTAHCTLYTVHCTLNAAHCTLHTAHNWEQNQEVFMGQSCPTPHPPSPHPSYCSIWPTQKCTQCPGGKLALPANTDQLSAKTAQLCALSKETNYEVRLKDTSNSRTRSCLTNFSLNTIVCLFEKFPKSPYESHLARHTGEPLKKIVKILEARPQSSKNAQKSIKII